MRKNIKLYTSVISAVALCTSCNNVGDNGNTANVANSSTSTNKVQIMGTSAVGPKLISTCKELQDMQKSPLLEYKLVNNIDCSSVDFEPIDIPRTYSNTNSVNMAKTLLDDTGFSIFGIDKLYTSQVDIRTCEDLQAIKYDLTGIYTIKNDIDCATENVSFMSIGTDDEPFRGKIYGNRKTIKNITAKNNNFVGIFANTRASFMSNLRLENINITSSSNDGNGVGALVSNDEGSKFADIMANKININVGIDSCAGGIIGYMLNSNLQSVAVNNSNISAGYAGGIGCSYDGANIVVNGVFTNGTVNATNSDGYAGGILAGLIQTNDPDENNDNPADLTMYGLRVESANISSLNVAGGIGGQFLVFGSIVSRIQNAQVSNTTVNGAQYSTGYLFGITQGGEIINDNQSVRYSTPVNVSGNLMSAQQDLPIGTNLSGTTRLVPSAGIAPANKEIKVCDDLQNIQNNLSQIYTLKNNIDCTGKKFKPIGSKVSPFTGTLNGNGYGIYYLNISETVNGSAGLFAFTKNATIKNIQLILPVLSMNKSDAAYIGSISGFAELSSFENITVSNLSLSAKDIQPREITRVGGVIGNYVRGNAVNIEVNGKQTKIEVGNSNYGSELGGVVGTMSDVKMNNISFQSGTVQQVDSVPTNLGGIVGAMYSRAKLDAPIVKDASVIRTLNTKTTGGIAGRVNYSYVYSAIVENIRLVNFDSSSGYLVGLISGSSEKEFRLSGVYRGNNQPSINMYTNPIRENLTEYYGYSQMRQKAAVMASMLAGNGSWRSETSKQPTGKTTSKITLKTGAGDENVWIYADGIKGHVYSGNPLKEKGDPRNVCIAINGTSTSIKYTLYEYTFADCTTLY